MSNNRALAKIACKSKHWSKYARGIARTCKERRRLRVTPHGISPHWAHLAHSVAVYFPAVVDQGHLSGHALLTVDACKFVRRRYGATIHRHNDIARLDSKLANDAALGYLLDKYPAAWVPRKPASNFGILLLLILLDRSTLPWSTLGGNVHGRRGGGCRCRMDDGGGRGKCAIDCGLVGWLPARKDPPTDDRTNGK